MRFLHPLSTLMLLAVLLVACGGGSSSPEPGATVHPAAGPTTTLPATVAPTVMPSATPPAATATPSATPTATPEPADEFTVVAEPLGDLLFTGVVHTATEDSEEALFTYPSIYAIGATGAGLHPVTDTWMGDDLPRWAPDGMRFAFVTDTVSARGPRIMLFDPADGVSHEALGPSNPDYPLLERIHEISWSPDGAYLLVSADVYATEDTSWDAEKLSRLYRLRVATGEVVSLSSDQGQHDYTAAWSPDGMQIAFGRTSTDPDVLTPSIWIMAADGSNERQIIEMEGSARVPLWSPDGTRLLFTHLSLVDDDVAWAAMVVGTDGQGLVNLTETTRSTDLQMYDVAEKWSPVDDVVLLTRYSALQDAPDSTWDHGQVWVMNADGSDARAITPAGVSVEFPAWSPDGSDIAFMARVPATDGSDDGGPHYELRVMRADGTGSRTLAGGISDLPQRVHLLQWRPTVDDPYAYEQRVTDLRGDGAMDLLGVDLRLDPDALAVTFLSANPFSDVAGVASRWEAQIDAGAGLTYRVITTLDGAQWRVEVSDSAGVARTLEGAATIRGSEQRTLRVTVPRDAVLDLPTLFRWSASAWDDAAGSASDQVPDSGWIDFPIARGAIVPLVTLLPDVPLPDGLAGVPLPGSDADAEQFMSLMPDEIAGLERDASSTVAQPNERRLFWGPQANVIFSLVNTRVNWFFPGAPSAGGIIVGHVTDPSWKALAYGQDGDMVWARLVSVQTFEDNPALAYTLWWGVADGDWIAIAVADSPEQLDALVSAIVSAAASGD